MMRSVFASLLVVATMSFVGCMPATAPPKVDGPIDRNTASQLQAKIRSKHGPTYSIEHEVNGKPFQANWELSNSLKQTAQLQIKPPGDWTEVELYQALEVVLNDHESNPWYSDIDDMVLKLMRRSLQSGVGDVARDTVPDTPYEISATTKKNGDVWFLQIKTKLLDEDGNSIGF